MNRIARGLAAAAVVLGGLRAQCSLQPSTLPGLNGLVYSSAAWDPDGTGPLPPYVLVGGLFTSAGVLTANHVAACDPQTGTWSVFGSGVAGTVTHVVALPGGQFVVGGSFASAGGAPANNVALWIGTAWAPLGAGVPGAVAAMVVTANHEVLVSHSASTPVVSRWNGVAWTNLGASAPGYPLAVAANGDILAGGQGGVWRWTGTAWALYAGGVSDVLAMAPMPDGRLFAAAVFPFQSTHFATFDGTSWTLLGGTLVNAYSGPFIADIEVLPDGTPIACGIFGVSGGLPAAGHFVRWNGSAWTTLTNPTGFSTLMTVTFLPDGQLVVGSSLSNYLGRLATTCPAQSAPAGAGCASSGGANDLEVETLPWLGATYRARGTGLPALAIVTEVYGFSPLALPLASLLPQGQPGCLLLVSPDFVDVTITVGGAATTELAIPAAASLVGIGFRNQLNVFEVDAAGSIVAVTASNALSLTVGAF